MFSVVPLKLQRKTPMSTANSLELGMLALINDERNDAGLEPLRMITLLNDAAETHSAWMLEADQFSHQGEDGTTPSDRMEQAGYPFEGNSLALENIGWQSARGEDGFVDDVAQVHASLMNSAGHRANILNPDAEDVGIGIEVGTFSGASGEYEAVMVTQVYGSTDADISAWIDPETGDDGADVVDDQIAEGEEDTPDIPDTTEAEDDTATPDDVVEEPTDAEDDTDPIVGDDMSEDDTDEQDMETDEGPVGDVPVAETPGEDDSVNDEPLDDMPEIIAIDDAPACAMTSLTVDISDVFEIKRDGDQITLETTQDKLITAFMDAFDDWAFLNELPDEESALDVSDLMIDGVSDDGGAFACETLEDDAEDIAAQCI
jgi:uncharacterized protein YkwD